MCHKHITNLWKYKQGGPLTSSIANCTLLRIWVFSDGVDGTVLGTWPSPTQSAMSVIWANRSLSSMEHERLPSLFQRATDSRFGELLLQSDYAAGYGPEMHRMGGSMFCSTFGIFGP